MYRLIGRPPSFWLKAALLCFGAWLGVVCSALLVEHTTVGSLVFHNRVTMAFFLAIVGVLYVLALTCCVMTLVKGSTAHRAIIMLPLLLLVLFGLVAIGGPG